MIRVYASRGGAAKAYFGEGLSRADYYTQEIIGRWHGAASEILGLEGDVTKKAFAQLCDNLHPFSGERLTPRNDANRIDGWDFSFHAPKSLSLAHSLLGDDRVIEAFRESVTETMGDIEEQISTRVRSDGNYSDRWTGNLAWGEFVHLTARPVDGVPDPHLHVHSFVINATFDDVEARWKAAKIRDAKRDLPFHQAAFHARLAKRISDFGYEIRRTRSNWEIVGMSPALLQKFSRRTDVIEEEAKRLGITEDKEKELLGAKTREGKRKGMSDAELQQAWETKLSKDDRKELAKVQSGEVKAQQPITAKQAIDHAIEKQFAKDAVVRKSRLLAAALKFGVGKVTPESIRAEYGRRNFVEKVVGEEMLCTTYDVLAEEVALLAHVRTGKSNHAPLAGDDVQPTREFLSGEQRGAFRHILSSNDRVIAIRGAAGTGKTTVMKEIVEAIEARGKRVIALAPSADASRGVLRDEGFEDAETVAHFLQSEVLQRQARNQVIWIDEAGLLGTREMWQVLETAGPRTRIILTGDTKQHGPVSRGNPLRTMELFGGLRFAEITEIRRQDPEEYKKAVAALSEGKIAQGFQKLEKLGAIKQVADAEARYRQLADDYVALTRGKQKPLVISPTHAEGRQVTAAIRSRLKESGKLKDEREFFRYRNLYWDDADKKEAENYSPGMMVQFHQNTRGVMRGERFCVKGVDQNGKISALDSWGAERDFSVAEAKKFQVFMPEPIKLAQGDTIRITRNGFSADGRRHDNGMVREVAGFTPDGAIKLTTGAIIAAHDGHYQYGYCQTSHATQGKSVNHVLVAQSSTSFPASSREQFYVSASRGKESLRIYTDDKEALQEAVGNSSVSISAIEMAGFNSPKIQKIMQEELTGDYWQSVVGAHRSRAEAVSFVDRINQERNQGRAKPPQMSWAGYVDMKRGMRGGGFRGRSMPGSKKDQGIERGKEKGKQPEAKKPQQAQQKPAQNRRQAVMAKMGGKRDVKVGSSSKKHNPATVTKQSHIQLAKQGKLVQAQQDRAKRIQKQPVPASVKQPKQVVVKPPPTPKK